MFFRQIYLFEIYIFVIKSLKMQFLNQFLYCFLFLLDFYNYYRYCFIKKKSFNNNIVQCIECFSKIKDCCKTFFCIFLNLHEIVLIFYLKILLE